MKAGDALKVCWKRPIGCDGRNLEGLRGSELWGMFRYVTNENPRNLERVCE